VCKVVEGHCVVAAGTYRAVSSYSGKYSRISNNGDMCY